MTVWAKRKSLKYLPQSDVVDLAPDGLSRSLLLTLSGQFFTETLAPKVGMPRVCRHVLKIFFQVENKERKKTFLHDF